MRKERMIVGLAGGSASGKTSFIKALSSHFKPSELAILSQDNYYKPLSKQQFDDQGEINFDLPSAIDFKRLRSDLAKLSGGSAVEIVEYTFNNPSVFPKTILIHPAPIILVEGLFVYADPKLKKQFDWRLYIHAQPEIAISRRISRDTSERGMHKDQVLYQWQKHVLPAYDKHLEPHREDSHYIIDNTTHFNNCLNEVIEHFRNHLDLDQH
jgi:uridine kinase